MNIINFDNEFDFNAGIVELINDVSKSAIEKRGLFHIVLCGGTTPVSVYKLLRSLKTEWHCWQFWLCDERIPSSTFTDLNRYMIENELLNYIPVEKKQIHFIAIDSTIEIAVDQYEAELQSVALFDLCLLGIGEDGHTASLFPGNDCGENENAKNVLAVFDSPKPPKQRISLSAKRLSLSEVVLFITSGKEKKSIIDRVMKGENLPCNLVKGKEKTLLFYTEKK